MKICIIVDDYMPNSVKVAGKMMHELALEFHQNNHIVSVITPDDSLKEKYTIELYQGIKICRFKSGKIKNTWKPIRLLNEFFLSFRAKKYLKHWLNENPQDIIVFYSPTIFFSNLVSFLKKIWKCKSYLVLRDFFPQWTIDNGILKEGSFLVKFFRYYERQMYQVADRIGIQSPSNLRWYQNKFPKFSNVSLLYNWISEVSEDSNTKLKRSSSFRMKWNLMGKVIFFYGGNIGKAQHMASLLRLAELMLEEETASFIFLGAGDEYAFVEQQIESRRLKNTLLFPSVSQFEYIEILNEVDVGCISLNPMHKTHNFPGKILSYMQQGLPVLGCVNAGNDLKELINSSSAGYISIAGEDEVLYKNAKLLLNQRHRLEVGKNAKQTCKDKFSVKSAANEILSIASKSE